ncbi:MAG: AMP-binding protein [Streptosporangiales bacterium]|nr:AMP-binding protein [Streptosporangiales bacterium]
MAIDVESLALDQPAELPGDAFQALRRAADLWGARDFIVVDHRAQVVSFAELLEHATTFGELLRHRGVKPGDRVGLALANSVEWAAAAFAVFAVGGVVVPLSTRLVDREVRHCLEVTRPAAVVLHQSVRTRDLLSEWPSLREVERDDGAPIDVWVHRTSGQQWTAPEPQGEAVGSPTTTALDDLDGAAVILFTSGTTSAPKGVVLTHHGLLRLAYEVGRRQGLGPDDRFFSIAPFFHCSGLMHAMLTTLLTGATLFTATRYRAQDVLGVLRDESITVSHGPLPAADDVRAHPDPRGFPQFTRGWAGGTSDDLADLESAMGTRLCSLWGMTETGGCFALTTADDPRDVRHGTAGFPLPGLEFRIAGADGSPVDGAEPGELCVRGWNVTPGYFRDPAASASAIRDGWLHTGDRAARLPDGRLRFLGRQKDIIRVGGENVAPTEIESVLTELDAVTDAAVIAAPDARLGEVPVGIVVLTPGGQVTASGLTEHCRTRLASFKVPRDFFLVDGIPRTHATNRIQRTKLHADVRDGKATHVR